MCSLMNSRRRIISERDCACKQNPGGTTYGAGLKPIPPHKRTHRKSWICAWETSSAACFNGSDYVRSRRRATPMNNIWQLWRKFWFEPQSMTTLALYRILFGLLVLQSLVVHLGIDFLNWYGPNAVIPIEAIKQYFWWNEPRFDMLLLLPKDNAWFVTYYILLVIATICATIGLGTRFTVPFVSLSLISLHHHNPFNINGGDTFLRLTSIFLALSPCGQAWSLDNIIKRKRGIAIEKLHSPWAWRMIQVQLAIAYCDTFFCKVAGQQWLDGTAVYYATRLEDLFRFDVSFLFDNIWFCKILTWYTLIIEFAMWTLVWFRPFRYFILAGALLLHLGIDVAINLPVFEWAFIACLCAFIYPDDLEQIKDRLSLELKNLKTRPTKVVSRT